MPEIIKHKWYGITEQPLFMCIIRYEMYTIVTSVHKYNSVM